MTVSIMDSPGGPMLPSGSIRLHRHWATARGRTPSGVTHAELNAGAGESVALVYFDGPVDFVLAE